MSDENSKNNIYLDKLKQLPRYIYDIKLGLLSDDLNINNDEAKIILELYYNHSFGGISIMLKGIRDKIVDKMIKLKAAGFVSEEFIYYGSKENLVNEMIQLKGAGFTKEDVIYTGAKEKLFNKMSKFKKAGFSDEDVICAGIKENLFDEMIKLKANGFQSEFIIYNGASLMVGDRMIILKNQKCNSNMSDENIYKLACKS